MNQIKKSLVFLFLALVVVISSCSTKRNTRLSRNYHGLTARYNIYFNGNESYLKGSERIKEALVDDYSRILPMFYYSIHENLGMANSDMDRAIEKSKKVIKKHSIRRKPKFNSARSGDASYVEWFRREEFNVMIDDAYMLMGKAHFLKGEFLEAYSVFNYVKRHFASQFVKYEAELWMARCYAELGWFYEAEDVLKKANDDNFPFQLSGDFAAINADLQLKRGQYKEAIPFLKEAIQETKDRKIKRRYLFILAQLYQESENYENAVATYNQVLKMSPPYDMEFNSRIRLTEVFQGEGNAEGIKKELRKMLKDEKNKDYLDQIYYALANIELAQDKIEPAIENYLLSIENSTQNKIQKGLSHITLADMYFKQKQYREAQPHYAGAAAAFGPEYPGYREINNLAGVLNEMAGYYETIEYQDSLQMVANLTPSEQDALIANIITKVIEDEAAAEKALEKGQRVLNLSSQSDWYFYNEQLVQRGREDFKRLWGNRPKENNWRRSKKVSSGFGDLAQVNEEIEDTAIVFDNKSRGFYLQYIPSSEKAFKASDNKIAEALFGLGEVFRTELNDYKQAQFYYKELTERFPKNEKVLESYFGLYRSHNKLDETAEAEHFKSQIISEFPNSRYAVILSDPNYVEKLKFAEAEQDSLYEASYKAYMSGDFETVQYNYKTTLEKYPDTKLKPNFMFLNALIIGVNDSASVFRKELELLQSSFPNAGVTKQAASILAQMDAGKTPSGSKTTLGSLLAKRNELLDELGMEQFEDSLISQESNKAELFTFDEEALHYFVMLIPTGSVDENQFLYEVARFNFTKFLIKDFDLSWVSYNSDTTMMIINGFNGLEESLWYQRTFILDKSLYEILGAIPYERLVISDRNFRALVTTRKLKVYKQFYTKKIRPLEGTIKDPEGKDDTSYNLPEKKALSKDTRTN